jgi:hypothetical protein
VEEQSRKGFHMLQQNSIIRRRIPNIPEVLTHSSAHKGLHRGTLSHGYRPPEGSLIRKRHFVVQCWWEAGLREDFP